MANDFLLVIDGSSLLSTQYYGNLPREVLYAKTEAEKANYYYKLMQTSGGVFTNGVFGFFKTLLSIIANQKPKYLAVCWDLSRDTFRRDIFEQYKGNRKSTPEPLKAQFALCQDMLDRIGIHQFSSKEFEADDYAGSLAAMFEQQIPVTVMTKDRDYLQLIDEHVSMWLVTASAQKAQELYRKHGVKQSDYIVPDNMFYLTPELVKKEFGYLPEKTVMVKQLAGDTADNIPGVKGIGEKTAIALANAYDSIEIMYDEIRDLDKKGLDEVKKRWKEDYGISRSPFAYLLAKSDEELVGEKGSIVSKELATIKRDVPLDGITLESLQTVIHADEVERVLHELEFKSLSLKQIDAEFMDGETSCTSSEYKVIMPAQNEANAWIKGALQSANVCVSLLAEAVKQKQPVAKQMSLFDFIVEDTTKQQVAEGEEAVQEDIQIRSNKQHIYALAFSYSEENCIVLTNANGYSSDMLEQVLAEFYKGTPVVSAFSVKNQLPLLPEEFRSNMILKTCSDGLDAFDIAVAAYLMNPLKSEYLPYEICQDYASSITNREQILNKRRIDELSEEEFETLIQCCAQEAYMGRVCQTQLQEQLQEQQMWELFCQIEMPTLYTLYEMEHNGVIVDREALRIYGDSLMEQIKELEDQIYTLAGRNFNINSPKQLGVVLFEELGLPASKKTKTGYSTSAEVLEGLKHQSPVVSKILEYRQLTKLHSTYAVGLSTFIQKDGRIHGHFNQTVTATGRISSTEPNLQNIPMRTELGRAIRKVFLPQEGSVFIDADYSQIELRILAHMSGDEKLIQAYKDGQDIHTLTASQVFHVPFDEVDSLQRRNAKAVNFGIVYGISAHGLSVDLGIERKEAAEYIERYFASYPNIKVFLDGLVEEGKKEGMVRTMFGRIRPIPELHSTNFNQRNFGERVAMNSPIQGTAADIMKIAMVHTYRGLQQAGLASKLVLQIHDELVVETKKEEMEQVKTIITEAMTNAAKLAVELVIDMNVGDTWYDAK